MLFENNFEIPNSDLSELPSNEINNSTGASNSKDISEVRIRRYGGQPILMLTDSVMEIQYKKRNLQKN
jgi:hypothetical protein